MTQIEDTTEDVTLGDENERDRMILVTILVLGGLAVLLAVTAAVLRIRSRKMADKRAALVRQSMDREAFLTGRADVHAVATALTDHIFAVFRALGCPHDTGELPVDYAARLTETFGALSTAALTDVMEIIEKEAFGGTLTSTELTMLGRYAADIDKSVYAGAGKLQKLRLRYILALV